MMPITGNNIINRASLKLENKFKINRVKYLCYIRLSYKSGIVKYLIVISRKTERMNRFHISSIAMQMKIAKKQIGNSYEFVS